MLTISDVNLGFGKKILAIVRVVCCVAVLVLSITALLNPLPSLRLITLLCGSIGMMVLFLVGSSIFLEDMIALGIGIRQDIKLVEIQNIILNEIKKNNKQVIDLVVSQAELLTKMTGAAIKKNDPK